MPHSNPPQKPTAPSPAHKAKKRGLRKSVLRISLWFLLIAIGSIAALLGGAWWWMGQSDSLARTIAIAQRYLPAPQQLHASDVSGNLRTGGRIGALHYANATIAIDVQDATIGWSLSRLWARELRFDPIHIAEITLTPLDAQNPQEPAQPLAQLTLPVRLLQVPFAVDKIAWAAASEPTTVLGLQGQYRYSDHIHQLHIAQAQAFNGHYQAQITLGGKIPMSLDAALQATLDVPASRTTPAVHARLAATAQGKLAGHHAQLQVRASAEPSDAKTAAAAMQARLEATIYPYKPWPLGTANAQIQNLNLRALWPQLPATLLSGSLTAKPADAAAAQAPPESTSEPTPAPRPITLPVPLQLTVAITNALPGPANTQHLPISQINARALFDGLHVELLDGSTLHLGGGSLKATGHYRLADHQFALHTTLSAINPALVDTRISSQALSGTAQAETEDDAINFDVNIVAGKALAAKTTKVLESATLPIEHLIAQGRWHAPVLQLQTLQLDALHAHIGASQLTVNTAQISGQGAFAARLPGATLALQAQAGPGKRSATATLDISSAEQLLQWLRRLPGVADVLAPSLAVQGSLNAQLHTRGDWGDALRQLQQTGLLAPGTSTPNAPEQGTQPFALEASIRTPTLSVRTSGDETNRWQLRNAQITANGNLNALQAELNAQARHGAQQFAGQLSLAAKRIAALQWTGSINHLQVSASSHNQVTPWQLALQQPLAWHVKLANGKKQPLQIGTSAAKLQVTGPEPGTANIEWQPLELTMAEPDKKLQLRSAGTLTGLPLRWAKALRSTDNTYRAALLESDLVLQARWDVDTQNGLKAKLLIERSSGDLQLHPQGSQPQNITVHQDTNGRSDDTAPALANVTETIAADIRNATLELNAQDQQVQARLHWESANAGSLHAQLQTQLHYGGGDFTQAHITADAPLSGTIQAQIPDWGIWAIFAPPGWRVAGSLAADVSLGGSWREPHYSGHLSADKMHIQSQLDGIDLRNGFLRARLQGNELTLQNLHFEGGQGSQARIIGYSGNLTPAPTDGGTLNASGTIAWSMPEGSSQPSIRMDIRAQAKALQVLVRADRQISLSGDMRCLLQQGQLSLSGDLRVDRASILLANESAPQLGSDVHVYTQASRRAAAEKQLADNAQAGHISPAKPMLLDIHLNLGRDFALQGYGITTRLQGSLNIQNSSQGRGDVAGFGTPRITGEIHTVEGRYPRLGPDARYQQWPHAL